MNVGLTEPKNETTVNFVNRTENRSFFAKPKTELKSFFANRTPLISTRLKF